MKKRFYVLIVTFALLHLYSFVIKNQTEPNSWIRINLLGYLPKSTKVAVWCSRQKDAIITFQIIDATSGKKVYEAKASKPFGAYGPFTQTCRLNFSAFNKPGRYIIKAGNVSSPEFTIGPDVYKGAANFCL